MSTVSADFYKERVILDTSAPEALLLAQVFDRAAHGPDGRVRDAGWLEVFEGLSEAGAAGVQAGTVTLSDSEMEIRVSDSGVRMAFDPGIAEEVANEIESCIPELIAASWYKIADQIRVNAADISSER